MSMTLLQVSANDSSSLTALLNELGKSDGCNMIVRTKQT